MEARRCRCGTVMETGFATAQGLLGTVAVDKVPRLVFVVPGEPTSGNPVAALQQGLADAEVSRAYLLRGNRCPVCEAVELIAAETVPWAP